MQTILNLNVSILLCMVRKISLQGGDVEWGKSICSRETKGDRGDEGYIQCAEKIRMYCSWVLCVIDDFS